MSFAPDGLRWKIYGEIEGAGTVSISSVTSKRVTGQFSIAGGGEYYSQTASVSFTPEGKASGRIRVSLRFEDDFMTSFR